MSNELTFPKYLPYKGNRTYSILGYIGEVPEYKDNKGYVDKKTGSIYICFTGEHPIHDDTPLLKVVHRDSGDIVTKIEANAPQIISTFMVSNLYSLDYKTITENTSADEQLYNEEALQDMNAATSVFIPIINDDDDPLKKIIKKTIINKKIDINALKHRMPQKYGLTNIKSALVGSTKMSITNFNLWCELLNVNYEIIITDSGDDSKNPLHGVIHYSNDTNRLVETKR